MDPHSNTGSVPTGPPSPVHPEPQEDASSPGLQEDWDLKETEQLAATSSEGLRVGAQPRDRQGLPGGRDEGCEQQEEPGALGVTGGKEEALSCVLKIGEPRATLENLSTFQVGSGVRTFHQRQGEMLEGFQLAVSEARLYFGKFPKVVGGNSTCKGCSPPLLSLPLPLPAQLTQRLDLQGNMLKVIPPAAFQDLPYLTHLDLRHCQVELVAEGAFRGLGRLLLLNLASNRLSSLPQEALDGLGSLRRLELEGNMLEELRPGTFGALGALATLNLAHNALVYLPAMAFQGLTRTRRLQLSHNALSVLAPEALAGLPALRRLSLHHNELQALPGPALSQAGGLARLELGHNPFTYVGEEDGLALPGLRELMLDHGALQALDPRAFAHCPRLHTLDLRGNQLAALPPLQGPGQLRRLRLQGNPLWCGCQARPLLEWLARARVRADGTCRGPRRLGGEALDALRPADLRCPGDRAEEEEERRAAARPRAPTGAPQEADGAAQPCPRACVCAPESRHSGCESRGLRAVPRGFPNDIQLLDLRRNHFPSVPGAAFPGLGRLVSLHLQHCGITELEAGALAGLSSLIYLYLSDNQLSGLSAAALEGAPRLGYLYLERNRFLQVPGAALRALPSLFSLHLQNNAVDRLEPGDLTGLRTLRWLYLSGNRITQVSPGAIGPAPELEKLHLDRNQLQGVPTGALEGLPALLELQLSGNPLKTLPDGAFRPVGRSLQHLFLNSSGLEQVGTAA
ncbi:chondroadherin-like protein [Ursus arctos]|uniref:chondroadherin-like protein n=1 Tax=Ursus arctos TaxID=9644 RepID=UPI0025488AC0|nr:chondroadherin-like protein [Ursus arctos]